MMWGRGPYPSFDIWISGCPGTIYWKVYSFPHKFVQAPLSTDHSVIVYFFTFNCINLMFMYSLMSVPHYLDYNSFVVGFEIESMSLTSFLTFKVIWAIFHIQIPSFSYEVYDQLMISTKSQLELHWVYRSVWGVFLPTNAKSSNS